MGKTYKQAGVDISAGDLTVDKIKPMVRSTHNEKVLSDIGLFGGFYDGRLEEYKHPVLVGSTDGVGTKLKIAFMADKHDTVGEDLVNHCVNDILACGARPLFFLDYFGTGKLSPNVAVEVISGFVRGCKNNGCALIGGETAEMPSLYSEGEYDLSGTIVGVVEKDGIVNGKTIEPGDIMIGLPSNGLHTNGYSLARLALLEKYKVDQYIDALGMTLGDALLQVHRSYLKITEPLLDAKILKGISHITGGGIVGNTKRILSKELKMNINWKAWERPEIFKLIQEAGQVEEEEMREVFNIGIGIIYIVSKSNSDKVLEMLAAEKPVVMGEIAKA